MLMFFSALSRDLLDNVISELNIKIRDLTKLTDKVLQLEALCRVNSYASQSYRILFKQKSAIKLLLRDMHPVRNRGVSLGIQGKYTSTQDLPSHDSINFQKDQGYNFSYTHGTSVAEQAL